MKPQDKLILKHLFLHRHITPVEAAAVYKVRSLSSRISTLKKMGHSITKAYLKDGMGQRYAKYYYSI